MLDKVKGKKIGDFAYWISLESDIGDATILAFKRPENEKRTITAEASLTEGKVGGQYSKESGGSDWDTIILTKEHGVLPMETWKTKAGMEKIKDAVVGATGASGPLALGQPFVANVPTDSFYHCKNCGESIVFAYADGLCPSCGKKFTA